MTKEDYIRKHLTELGLKQEEIDKLKIEDAIQYIRFCHWKEWGASSILFIGFSNEEIKILTEQSENCHLTVKNRLSNNLSFICLSENAAQKRIEKAKNYSAIILTKNEFEIIFNGSEYNLLDNELLYDQLVSKEFRITKPLSNFDKNIGLESFSFDSENIYSVNLYQMTCTCKDFEKKQRNLYLNGDIRRMCKHLIDAYKNCFGLNGLSDLNRFIIKNGYPLNKYFRYFDIEKIPLPIVVNFESKDSWWNIFMANEKGIYSRYGYSPLEKRFSYDDKPRGFVRELRKNLDALKYQLDADNSFISNTLKKGCAYSVMAILLIFASIIVLIVVIILYAIIFSGS